MTFLRRLSDAEVERYDLIPASVSRRVVLMRVPLLPGGYSGLTLSNLVLLARSVGPNDSSSLLAHELVHVRQYHEQGLLRFAWNYGQAFLGGLRTHREWNKAYRDIPAEQEARHLAGQWARKQAETAHAEHEDPQPEL